jgi:hypothetical protein
MVRDVRGLRGRQVAEALAVLTSAERRGFGRGARLLAEGLGRDLGTREAAAAAGREGRA